MDKKSIIVSICCSLVITGIAAFMVHSNLTEDINLIGRSAQARTARLERDTEESLSSYQSGIEDNYLNISNSYEYIDNVRNGIQNDISILRAEMNRVQETLNSSFADLSASVNAGQTATIETQARLGNIAEDLYQLSIRIDELEQEPIVAQEQQEAEPIAQVACPNPLNRAEQVPILQRAINSSRQRGDHNVLVVFDINNIGSTVIDSVTSETANSSLRRAVERYVQGLMFIESTKGFTNCQMNVKLSV
jgi:septal ring factor EnvC (AmiA/AmiB activator)